MFISRCYHWSIHLEIFRQSGTETTCSFSAESKSQVLTESKALQSSNWNSEHLTLRVTSSSFLESWFQTSKFRVIHVGQQSIDHFFIIISYQISTNYTYSNYYQLKLYKSSTLLPIRREHESQQSVHFFREIIFIFCCCDLGFHWFSSGWWHCRGVLAERGDVLDGRGYTAKRDFGVLYGNWVLFWSVVLAKNLLEKGIWSTGISEHRTWPTPRSHRQFHYRLALNHSPTSNSNPPRPLEQTACPPQSALPLSTWKPVKYASALHRSVRGHGAFQLEDDIAGSASTASPHKPVTLTTLHTDSDAWRADQRVGCLQNWMIMITGSDKW